MFADAYVVGCFGNSRDANALDVFETDDRFVVFDLRDARLRHFFQSSFRRDAFVSGATMSFRDTRAPY